MVENDRVCNDQESCREERTVSTKHYSYKHVGIGRMFCVSIRLIIL
jgi:hypothetical protein